MMPPKEAKAINSAVAAAGAFIVKIWAMLTNTPLSTKGNICLEYCINIETDYTGLCFLKLLGKHKIVTQGSQSKQCQCMLLQVFL